VLAVLKNSLEKEAQAEPWAVGRGWFGWKMGRESRKVGEPGQPVWGEEKTRQANAFWGPFGGAAGPVDPVSWAGMFQVSPGFGIFRGEPIEEPALGR